MAGSTHPIVDCNKRIYPFYINLKMPLVLLPDEVVFAGFRHNNVSIELICMTAHTMHCTGNMCNKQRLYRNGQMGSTCSCISNAHRICPTILVIDQWLTMTSTNGESITINKYTSTWFTNNNLFKERLIPHVKVATRQMRINLWSAQGMCWITSTTGVDFASLDGQSMGWFKTDW